MTDEELDALVQQAMDRAIGRLQQLHDYAGRPAWDQVLREELSKPITTLRAQLAEARAERDEWKKAATARHPNPADHRYWEGRYRDEKDRADRADRAEAALAAQIEVDAEIVQRFATGHFAEGMVLERAALNRAAAIIRNQPHDRTALDRYREKALREAAEILDDEGWLGMSKHRILALIEKGKAE